MSSVSFLKQKRKIVTNFFDVFWYKIWDFQSISKSCGGLYSDLIICWIFMSLWNEKGLNYKHIFLLPKKFYFLTSIRVNNILIWQFFKVIGIFDIWTYISSVFLLLITQKIWIIYKHSGINDTPIWGFVYFYGFVYMTKPCLSKSFFSESYALKSWNFA